MILYILKHGEFQMSLNLPTNPVDWRALLEALWGHPEKDSLTPRQRVLTALAHQQPDRIPFDFWAVPEVIKALVEYLGARDEEEMLRLLGVDCRLVRPDYIGPTPQIFEDGTFYTPWGSHRRLVHNDFSTYEEYASFPLAEAKTAAEVQAWPRWPKPEYWDWAGLPAKIREINREIPYHIRYEVGGIFESAWALYGLDRFLVDFVENPEVPCAILDCYTDLMIGNVHRLMQAAQGLIDMVYTYDDVAIQNGLLMSPAMWRKFILPRHQRLNAVIKSYGLKIMYHSCGAVFKLIPAFINDMGIDVLNPLQPRAALMDMQKIKDEFGAQVSFHGGLDLQETMPHGSPEDVRSEVLERCRILGKGGGYICTTAHYIQADVPLQNILTLYSTPRTLN